MNLSIHTYRGAYVETIHHVRAVAVRVDSVTGKFETIYERGEPFLSPWRSAGKPFQLMASLQAILGGSNEFLTALAESSNGQTKKKASNKSEAETFFSPEEIAIGTSSHSGCLDQTAVVTGLLDRFQVHEEDLLCGAEAPLHEATLHNLLREQKMPTQLHNDCSGKHCMMLGACVAQGWDLKKYTQPDHPLQVSVRQIVQQFTRSIPAEQIGDNDELRTAVDGCGVPVFILSMDEMAVAYANIARAMVCPIFCPLLSSIGHSMVLHPYLISGPERLETRLAPFATEAIVLKIGADGIFCVALPQRCIGLALKVQSGNWDALAVAVRFVLDAVAPGALLPDPSYPYLTVLNVVGKTVGKRIAVETLLSSARKN